MFSFTVSPDGRGVAYLTKRDAAGGGLWYAELDQRSPPRNLVMSGVLNLTGIGASGVVFYIAQDAQGGHTYRIAPDGTEPRPVIPGLVRAYGGTANSPDGRWVMGNGSAYPLNGGRPVSVCATCSFVWSPDGKSVAMTLHVLEGAEGVTGVIPLPGNSMFPPLPPKGIQSVDDLKKIPGSQVIPYESVSAGPAGSYAYTKNDTLRNLYRIPLP